MSESDAYQRLPWHDTKEDAELVAATVGIGHDTLEFDLADPYGYTYDGPEIYKVLGALARADITPTLSGRVHDVASGLLAALQDERLPRTTINDRSPFETVALVTYLCGIAEGRSPWQITEWIVCHQHMLAALPAIPRVDKDFPPYLADPLRHPLQPNALALPIVQNNARGAGPDGDGWLSIRVRVTHSQTVQWSTVRDVEVPADRVNYLLLNPGALRNFLCEHGWRDYRDQYDNSTPVDSSLDDAVHVGPDAPLTYSDHREGTIAS